MSKFLFIYRESANFNPADISPDEMQSNMGKWMEWLGQGQEQGWVLAMGDPLTPDGRVVLSDKSITDGPYAESKELVGGYSIIQAKDYDQACEYAMGCPIYETGGVVEVRQIAEIPSE
ncbi:MAG: YciI family protein [Aureliella sp.]